MLTHTNINDPMASEMMGAVWCLFTNMNDTLHINCLMLFVNAVVLILLLVL